MFYITKVTIGFAFSIRPHELLVFVFFTPLIAIPAIVCSIRRLNVWFYHWVAGIPVNAFLCDFYYDRSRDAFGWGEVFLLIFIVLSFVLAVAASFAVWFIKFCIKQYKKYKSGKHRKEINEYEEYIVSIDPLNPEHSQLTTGDELE